MSAEQSRHGGHRRSPLDEAPAAVASRADESKEDKKIGISAYEINQMLDDISGQPGHVDQDGPMEAVRCRKSGDEQTIQIGEHRLCGKFIETDAESGVRRSMFVVNYSVPIIFTTDNIVYTMGINRNEFIETSIFDDILNDTRKDILICGIYPRTLIPGVLRDGLSYPKVVVYSNRAKGPPLHQHEFPHLKDIYAVIESKFPAKAISYSHRIELSAGLKVCGEGSIMTVLTGDRLDPHRALAREFRDCVPVMTICISPPIKSFDEPGEHLAPVARIE